MASLALIQVKDALWAMAHTRPTRT